MIQQEILKGLTLSVGNGGMSLTLELKPEEKKQVEKKEGRKVCQDTKK